MEPRASRDKPEVLPGGGKGLEGNERSSAFPMIVLQIRAAFAPLLLFLRSPFQARSARTILKKSKQNVSMSLSFLQGKLCNNLDV